MVAVLDWGLGHATRCVPIIEGLTGAGVEPVLATSGRAGVLLSRTFPFLTRVELPPYSIRYWSANMYWNMTLQAPRLAGVIRREHRLVQQLLDLHSIDAIISDNRYGCFSRNVPSVFITHQLNIYLPSVILSGWVNGVNHHLIRNFDECWIPDVPEAPGLAGSLAHPAPFPRVSYLGHPSRLHPLVEKIKYDYLVLLSGPEPQRTRLEELLMAQFLNRKEHVLFVLGKPEERVGMDVDNISVVSYLDGEALSQAMAASRQVICRSGYSTLLDLARLGKKAILVPTPGQTEQEYLARQLTEAGICYHEDQAGFTLERAIERSAAFRGFTPGYFGRDRVKEVIDAFLKREDWPDH